MQSELRPGVDTNNSKGAVKTMAKYLLIIAFLSGCTTIQTQDELPNHINSITPSVIKANSGSLPKTDAIIIIHKNAELMGSLNRSMPRDASENYRTLVRQAAAFTKVLSDQSSEFSQEALNKVVCNEYFMMQSVRNAK